MISNRAALVAVVVALLSGLLISLALRPPTLASDTTTRTSTLESGVAVRLRWRVPLFISENLPVLGENPAYVADLLNRASDGAIQLSLFDPGEIVPRFFHYGCSARGQSTGGLYLAGLRPG